MPLFRKFSPMLFAATSIACAVASSGWMTGEPAGRSLQVMASEAVAAVNLPGTHSEFLQKGDFRDLWGTQWTAPSAEAAPVIVVAFLGTECPLARQYALTLEKLKPQLDAKKVKLVAINANPQDSLTEIQAQARAQKLTYPIIKDASQAWLKELGAERTPQVFVLDANRKICYSGRIDDQHGIGKSRPVPQHEDLVVAVDEVLAGKAVSVPQTEVVGCLIGRLNEPVKNPRVTWAKDVAPILNAQCVECHRPGEIGPFSLTSYEETAGWGEMIVEVTQERRMPPWHADSEHGKFLNERRLSDRDLAILKTWVEDGMPQGNPAEAPPLPTFTEGWQLAREPDFVTTMSDKPFPVKASGEVKYQYFKVDPHFLEDKWVVGAEVVPGNRAVVHHVIVFASEDGKSFDGERQFLVAYVPGLRLKPYPDGYAKKIAKGSKFIFQIHYTPNGEAQDDLTKLGLIFTDANKVKYEVKTESVANLRLRLEPNQDNQVVDARPATAPVDLQLLAFSPHMHLRGKSFQYSLQAPGEEERVVLNVPHFDFNWQTQYRLAEPIQITKGTKLFGKATYDNSAGNLANPDPSKTVTWGDQSWEEMMLGYFDVAIPKSAAQSGEIMTQWLDPKKGAAQLLKALDKNKNGKIEFDEAPAAHREKMKKLDKDGSGDISEDELQANWMAILRTLAEQR